jgi:putative ABC transport system ATP-binding protein
VKPQAIAIENVSKIYPGVHALENVTLAIEPGEWVAMMGPSGSGKTTLLSILNGLDRPTSGRVEILGTDTRTFGPDDWAVFRRENIGLVFQQFHLIPYLTAVENVMLAQYYHSMPDREQALEALARVQMADRAHHLPSQMSGGEQQRVCIARALINEPKIVLADEPTGNLDEENEERVLDVFRSLHREGKTLVVVTHDPEIGYAGERIIALGHGKVLKDTRNGEHDRRTPLDGVTQGSSHPVRSSPAIP